MSKHLSTIKPKNKKLVILISLVIVLVIAFIAVRAAFYGMGNRKGVAVTSDYYFTSNILMPCSNNIPNTYSYNASFNQNEEQTIPVDIIIKNYNNLNQPTCQDIKYKIEVALDKEDSNTNHKYSISYNNDTPQEITSTTYENFGEYTLSSDDLNSDKFTISYKLTANDELSSISGILVKATPIEPKSMKNDIIAANVKLSETSGIYSVSGKFLELEDDTTKPSDLGGFLYTISSSGAFNQEKITLTWDCQKLCIDPKNEWLPNEPNNISYTYDDTTDPEHKTPLTASITFDGEDNFYKTVCFFRGNTWNDATDNEENLNKYVTVTSNTNNVQNDNT